MSRTRPDISRSQTPSGTTLDPISFYRVKDFYRDQSTSINVMSYFFPPILPLRKGVFGKTVSRKVIRCRRPL